MIWQSELRHKSDKVYSEEQWGGEIQRDSLGLAHYDSINSLPYITDKSTATTHIKSMNKSTFIKTSDAYNNGEPFVFTKGLRWIEQKTSRTGS